MRAHVVIKVIRIYGLIAFSRGAIVIIPRFDHPGRSRKWRFWSRIITRPAMHEINNRIRLTTGGIIRGQENTEVPLLVERVRVIGDILIGECS